MKAETKIDVNEALSKISYSIRVVGAKKFKIKMMVATKLLWLVGKILNCQIKITDDNTA